MSRVTRTSRADAHHKSVIVDVNDIAGYLQETLGQKLVAYMTGVADPKGVGRWAQASQNPREDAERRLRAAFQIYHLLITV